MHRPQVDSVQAYSRLFTDADYWRPYVEVVCQRHRLARCREVRTGLPGTFPAFIVDGRYVVKFFGELFGGTTCFRVELEMYDLLAHDREIPAPSLVAKGELFSATDGWPWPYLVSTAIDGKSLAEVYEQVAYPDKLAIAQLAGPIVRRIHGLQPGNYAPLRPTWEAFDRFMEEQIAGCAEHHRAWGTLPERLVVQIDTYIPPLAELVDHSVPPHVLHCDLNADHVLGAFEGDRWRPAGIIDFGDAMVGDRVYELVALHLGLFRGDQQLLRYFLEAYGFDNGLRRGFVRRATSMTLLHQFNVLAELFPAIDDETPIESLQELGSLLWEAQVGMPKVEC